MDKIFMDFNPDGTAFVQVCLRGEFNSVKIKQKNCESPDKIYEHLKDAYPKNPEIVRGVSKGLMGISEHYLRIHPKTPQNVKVMIPSWQEQFNKVFDKPLWVGTPRPMWPGEVAFEFSGPGEINWGYNKWNFGSYRLFVLIGNLLYVCYTPKEAVEALNEVMAEAVLFDCSTHEIQCIRLRDYCLRKNENVISDKLLKFQSYDWADAVNPYKPLPCKRQY